MGILLDANKYEWFIKNLCGRAGLTEEAAEITAKVLVGNDKMGILTHGTYHLDSYIKKFAAGGIDPQAVPEVVAEGPAWALMDAHHAMGSVAGWKAMEKAIYKAGTAGVAYVGIKDSSHFGSCAYYALMAADAGMISIVATNTIKLMSAPGSRGRVIGNSPIAYALPAGRHYPVFLDVATSNVAFSKVMRAAEKGKKIPEGWLFDRNGKPTTDPSSPEATLAPFANHKGYGFAVFIEAISSVLANGKILGEVCQNGMEIAGNPFNVSHAFIVINAEMILGGAFRERMDRAIEEIIGSPKAEGSTRIYMPGEMEMEKKENAEIYGIDMPLDVYDHVRKLAESFEMDVSLCMKQ